MAQSLGLKLVLAGFCLSSVLSSGLVCAKTTPPSDLQQTVSLAELPRQGAQVYQLIYQGGPFASEKDGVVFGNRERLLPPKTRGYYREYTVPTPGVNNRGVRRIVCGGQPRTPDMCFYSADHYASFRRIVP